MLAWLRTGIALMGFGFVVARFGLFLRELAAARVPEPNAARSSLSLWIGTALVLLGVWVNLATAVQHMRFRRRFERGEPFTTPKGVLGISLSLLLAALGLGITLYLVLIVQRG